jgi:multiple sugar transport system permease protein
MESTTASSNTVSLAKSTPNSANIRAGRIMGRVLLYVSLIVLGLAFSLPFLWMISSALKDNPQTYTVPPIWIPRPAHPENFPDALTFLPFGLYALNTLRIAIPAAIGTVLSCAVVAYGFARLRWSLREPLFFLCIATMMIPFQVRMVPLFITFKNLGWINTFLPLIVPNWFGVPYFIFLLRQFFRTIPWDLTDAAKIDGCNELRTLWSVILPLAKPALAVVALFSIINAWNDYLGPLIYINDPDKLPIALGLQALRVSSTSATDTRLWPYLMAASTATILPILLLFFFAQRTFIEGITLTGVKG